jgi:hypothetical protein
MAQIKIYVELPDEFDIIESRTPAFMHDLVKDQLHQLWLNGEIKSFEWEIE